MFLSFVINSTCMLRNLCFYYFYLFAESSLILLDVGNIKTGETGSKQQKCSADAPTERRSSLSSQSSVSTTSTVLEFTGQKIARLSCSVIDDDARDSWEASRLSLMHTYEDKENVPSGVDVELVSKKRQREPLPGILCFIFNCSSMFEI